MAVAVGRIVCSCASIVSVYTVLGDVRYSVGRVVSDKSYLGIR